MKILILGGTGVISREIVKQGLEKGYDITIFNRGKKGIEFPEQVKVISGDRNDIEDFRFKMNDIKVDTVIDMICFNDSAAKQTVEIFRNKAKQIIITSSIAAYDRPYKSYPLHEDKEILSTNTDFKYGFDKAEMERYLQEEMGKDGAAITIIRPSLTFGDGAENFGILRQNRNIVRRIKEGKQVVMVGEGVIPWSFTFVEDLANGFILSCGNEKTYNKHFQITNDEQVLWEDIYKAVGKAVGTTPKMVYINSGLLSEMYPSVCSHLAFEKVHFSVCSIEKFQKAAPEYKPQVTLEEGIKKLVLWWEVNDFPYDEDKDILEDQICDYYNEFRDNILSLRR